jgi:hypothetical protein
MAAPEGCAAEDSRRVRIRQVFHFLRRAESCLKYRKSGGGWFLRAVIKQERMST